MINRRFFLTTATAAFCVSPAFSATKGEAAAFVNQVTSEIIAIVNAGKSTNATVKDFNRMLGQYADMKTISRSVLGPAARSASSSDLSKFATAFQGYVARKYGKQFGRFTNGTITVTSTKDRGKFFEVSATASTPSTSGVNVTFRVWDRPGSLKFIDILTEGISLVITERTEIGALLDKRGGNIARLASDLNAIG